MMYLNWRNKIYENYFININDCIIFRLKVRLIGIIDIKATSKKLFIIKATAYNNSSNPKNVINIFNLFVVYTLSLFY